MASSSNEQKIAEARKISKSNAFGAEDLYKEVLASSRGTSEAALRDYENALVGLGELYRDNRRATDLAELIKTSRSTLSSLSKAKTAKLGNISACALISSG